MNLIPLLALVVLALTSAASAHGACLLAAAPVMTDAAVPAGSVSARPVVSLDPQDHAAVASSAKRFLFLRAASGMHARFLAPALPLVPNSFGGRALEQESAGSAPGLHLLNRVGSVLDESHQ
ncbi:hypothetical protein GCM10008955_30600 [Deinococcus malanensis]|uniref:Uncharacterized protein n=1 Tax=Deinococcus malanensis TaxID=1706855 RepID=A0ABQ2EZB8_9DEIO|nr:hypothetical protein GCM10008955_30600 [Deinococcus malanensis]